MELNRERKFLDLVARVHACRKCPRMNDSARVLGMGCGSLNANVVFVGEAPGRLGADGSHLPFHGDKSGHNFESLIEQVGISRYKVFVTNAVLCNPKDKSGNNSTPSSTEVSNCAPFLREQLEILDPDIVVSLGAVALKAFSLIEPHKFSLKTSVRTSNYWFGRKLIPIYHPGQRAMVHRSFANQLSDYQFVAESARRKGSQKTNKPPNLTVKPGRNGAKLAHITRRILENQPNGVSYFALHKLYFLAEVAHMEAVGERLTNTYVIRQKDGPYCVDLHIAKLQTLISGIVIDKRSNVMQLKLDPQQSFEINEDTITLTKKEVKSIDKTVARYGALTDTELKRVTYLSTPMRTLLRKEKKLRVNLFNTAVLPYDEIGSSKSSRRKEKQNPTVKQ